MTNFSHTIRSNINCTKHGAVINDFDDFESSINRSVIKSSRVDSCSAAISANVHNWKFIRNVRGKTKTSRLVSDSSTNGLWYVSKPKLFAEGTGAFIVLEGLHHMVEASEGLVNWLSGWNSTVDAFTAVAGGAAGTLASLGADGVKVELGLPADLQAAILKEARQQPKLQGMGCTLVGVTFTDEGVVAGGVSSYRIRAFNEVGFSEWSNTAEVTLTPSPPAAPGHASTAAP